MDDLRERVINRHANPLLQSLPDKFERLYPNQIQGLTEVMAAFEDVDVVVLDAPTGTGKTVLGETARRLLKAEQTAYICHSLSLQDQFLADFPYAHVIKGRSNYPTEKYPERFVTTGWSPDHLSCEDCTWSMSDPECDWCYEKRSCPYEVAKTAALKSELCVANSAYYLSECNYVGKLSGRDLVIADEADTLESALMGFVSVEISRRRMEKWKWDPPKKSTVESSWMEWLDEKIPVVEDWLKQERGRARKLEQQLGPGSRSGPSRGSSGALQARREVRYLEGLWQSLRAVRGGLEKGEPWIYTGEGSSRDKTPGAKSVSFKPTKVDTLGKDALWRHGKKWLLMSATVISASEMLESLGWDGKWRLVKVESTFPVQNRKIYPVMVGKMGYNADQSTMAAMAKALVKVAERHRDDKILVHCVSYKLADFLAQQLKATGHGKRVVTHSNSAAKEEALGKYRVMTAAILLSPSMDRGVDLPGDLCRVQVICKIPFPSLGDKQVSTRFHSPGGKTWYSVQTIRTIVQMTGRAVRSPTDHASTYILDAQFQAMIWSRSRGLLPSWWAEAVDWREGQRLKGEIVG